jgi:hypothetical protein
LAALRDCRDERVIRFLQPFRSSMAAVIDRDFARVDIPGNGAEGI